MVKLAVVTSLLLLSASVAFGAPTIKEATENGATAKSFPPLKRGKVGTSVYYNAEARFLFNQKPHPLKGSSLKPQYGLLPVGTKGVMEDHKDIAALVVGDSFVAPLSGLFNDIALQRGVKFLMTSHPSCAAFFDKVSMDSSIHDWPKSPGQEKGKVECKGARRPEMLEMIKRSKAKMVFLAPNWVATPQIWQVKKMGEKEGLDPVTKTLVALSKTGKKIVLFGVIPGAHINVRACLAGDGTYAKKLNWFRTCAKESNILPPFLGDEKEMTNMERRAETRELLAKVLAKKEVKALNIDFIDPKASMCNADGKCMISKNGKPLYVDAMHLTVFGGKLMRKSVEAVMSKHMLFPAVKKQNAQNI